jgi:phytanoyl-CoA hydroxylase
MDILSKERINEFNEKGFIVVKNFLSAEEAALLYNVSKEDTLIEKNSYAVVDAQGNESRLALWHTPGDDIFGMLSRSEKLVNMVEQLIGGPVAHFHSKVMQKLPKVGGAWEWHQDYGYWYKNGFLYPDQMLSVMFALTKASVENGCLQVLPGSHRMGRIEHGKAGEQVGANMERVNRYMALSEVVSCELEPGDALFFHSNLLHASQQNTSDYPRWSIISCYNTLQNTPSDDLTSCFEEIKKVPHANILNPGKKGLSMESDFSSKKKDVALK